MEAWAADARTFVEFYTLLFVPLEGSTILPLDDRGILPWRGKESWMAFWDMMAAWNADPGDNRWQQWYNRSTWQIIRNMIDNLRLKSEERKLVTSWRNAAADRRDCCVETSETCTFNGAADNDMNADHYQILIEHLRAKHGADLSQREKEQRKKDKEDARIWHLFSTRILGGLRVFSPEFARRKNGV